MRDANDVLLLWHLLRPGVEASDIQGGGADVLDCDSLLAVEIQHDINVNSLIKRNHYLFQVKAIYNSLA